MNARYLLASALLAFAPAGFTLQANATLELTGVGTGTVADGVYVSPYVGNVNDGATYSGYMICDDFTTESYLNTPWTATVTNAGALGGPVKFTSDVLFGGNLYSAQQAYNAAAWLANGLLSPGILGNPVNQTNYAFAIWNIFDGQTTDPSGGALGMEKAAFNAVVNGGYVGNNVSVYTPTTWTQSQEFLVVNKMTAPEIDPTSAASSLTLLLGALAVVRGRTKRATVA
jgi:hypothetical protein